MTDVPNGSAVSGQPGAAGAGGESGAPWYAGIQDEGLRGYVQTKGFKDPAALAQSYQNLEKLQGVPQERLLKLPEKTDAPEWGDVWAKLGRPEDPKGYELKHEGDPAFADRMAAKMHQLGLPKSAAQGLNAEWNAYVNEVIAQDEQARKQKDDAEMAGLRTEWGQTFDANVEAGRRAGREFGLSQDQFDAMSGAIGSAATLKLFQSIGAKLGEAKGFDPSGAGQGQNGFGMTPEQARARISTLQQDREWVGRYLNGGATEKDEMTRLSQVAAGGA